MWNKNYFVYITTNPKKTAYYVGMTNNLERRLEEHRENKGKPETFAGKYYCYNLVYYERHTTANHAIEREGEVKLMNREEKEKLIKSANPKLLFLKIEG
ncbi:hypothetical protein AAE02nite_06420 [Adhaeribacter aerolatus]|uniref:GIY-YIG domain-containing protein n=1 Tax=Adhaeribacter aerolatus TaxID=670289 RepID=A0A512ATF7_9BACT|nr:GIY-YIG nuclease family protein [Adhaeribacter aerolatus]GEO02978.1 hypothetical protein AAE02nite_06420 [Adhaeribacter aerolatus]